MQEPATPRKPATYVTLMDGILIGGCFVAFALIIALTLQG